MTARTTKTTKAATRAKAAKPKAPGKATKDDIARALQGALEAIASSANARNTDPILAYMLSPEYEAAKRMATPATEPGAAPKAKAPPPMAAAKPTEPAKTYRIYTDGSCLGNGTSRARGGWAYLIAEGDDVTHRDSGGAAGEAATNNAMELLAIEKALEHTPSGSKVVIATDSQVSIGWLFEGWQCNVEHNRRLVARIKALMADRHVRHEKVKGHSSDRFNSEVDGMAVAAARRHA